MVRAEWVANPPSRCLHCKNEIKNEDDIGQDKRHDSRWVHSNCLRPGIANQAGVVVAKFEAKCKQCQKSISRGSKVAKSRTKNAWVHYDCARPVQGAAMQARTVNCRYPGNSCPVCKGPLVPGESITNRRTGTGWVHTRCDKVADGAEVLELLIMGRLRAGVRSR